MNNKENFINSILEVKKTWGDSALAVCYLVKQEPITFSNFLHHCKKRGEGLSKFLLSGIEELYPEVWSLICFNKVPEVDSIFSLLTLLKIDLDK